MAPDTGAEGPLEGFRQHSLVLEGSINPAIFQPRWLAAIGVIPFDEADAAEPPVVSASVTAFRTPRLQVQVTSERALFRTRGGELSAEELCEMVTRIFSELPHTPITSVDLVHEAHVPIDLVGWSDVKRALVPRKASDVVLPGSEVAFVELETQADDGSLVQVFLEQSQNHTEAMYIRVHREFALEQVDTGSVAQALDLVHAHWQPSLDDASTILGRMAEEFG